MAWVCEYGQKVVRSVFVVEAVVHAEGEGPGRAGRGAGGAGRQAQQARSR